MMNHNTLIFDEIYHLYYESLLKVIKRKICRHDLAEDILQEAFIKIWMSLPNYNSDKGSIYTWMATICKHLAIDQVKSRSYQQQNLNDQLELRIESIDTERSFKFNTDTIDVVKNMNELGKPYAQALRLFYFSGYTHEEIKGKLGIPLGTVKSRIRNGVRLLREMMNTNKTEWK